MSSAGRDALVAMLSRLKNDLARVNLGKPEEARRSLLGKYPLNGDYLAEVRRLCDRGIDDGWLCPPASDGRTSRLASSSTWFPFSIDATVLDGTGERYVRPKGEVSLSWPLGGKPKFCGREPGWTVFSPKSRSAPEAKGGSVFLLSFLPDGAVERKPSRTTSKAASSKKTSRPAARAAATRASAAPRKGATARKSAARARATSARR